MIEPWAAPSTFYDRGTYPDAVINRLAHGYFENSACAEYQPPDCKERWNAPLVGRDIREVQYLVAPAAGAAISSPRDVDRWVRAIFGGRWCRRSSRRNGVAGLDQDRRADHPCPRPTRTASGSACRATLAVRPQWFYEGVTLGYRTLYVWFAEEGILVTVQTNSQPPDGMDKLRDAVTALYEIVKKPSAD